MWADGEEKGDMKGNQGNCGGGGGGGDEAIYVRNRMRKIDQEEFMTG